MRVQQICDEIHSILDDMDYCMDRNKSTVSKGVSPSREKAYRAGYYAAVRDVRRLLAESHVIALVLQEHD